ncbi:MAG: hypothetical protein ACE5QV_06725 [Fidelibacterota bacterium]
MESERLLSKRKADIEITISRFDVPPMQDVLIVGKGGPLGKNALKRMADAVAPDQYYIIPVKNSDKIEAILIKKHFEQIVSKEKLVDFILSEVEPIMEEKDIMKIKMDIKITVKKELIF